MKKLLILIIVISSIIGLLFTTSCTASDIINLIVYGGEGSTTWEVREDEARMEIEQASTGNEEAGEEVIENESEETVKKDPEESESSTSNQSSTLTFDDSNSELGCSVWASITIKRKDNKNRELESSMILSPSTSYMDKNPTIFNITFNFDQGKITGGSNGIYYRTEEGEAYDSADIIINISNGTVTWDVDQGVWLFGGDVEMEVDLDMRNKLGSDGDKIFYGDANIETTVTGQIIGGSGQHERLDHHGELQTFGESFNITYEGEFPPATGNGELRKLTIDCWLALPLGETMASRFPQGP